MWIYCLFRMFLSYNLRQSTISALAAEYAGGELFSIIISKLGKICSLQCLSTNYSLEKDSDVLCKSYGLIMIWSLVLGRAPTVRMF